MSVIGWKIHQNAIPYLFPPLLTFYTGWRNFTNPSTVIRYLLR